MTFKPGFKARTLIGDFSYSSKLNQVSFPGVVEMLDSTTFADNGVKRSVPGLATSTASASGFADPEAVADGVAWTTAQPLTYGQEGTAHGSPVFMVDALKTSLEVGSPVAGLVSFDLAAQTDGWTNFGNSLHDLTAETATADGTGYDGAAATTAGGFGHLHVTAFSGFTNIIVTIQDSADNASFATIGTFATVTGATGERLAIAGTVRRYVRASWTKTGTGSCTFAVAFARN